MYRSNESIASLEVSNNNTIDKEIKLKNFKNKLALLNILPSKNCNLINLKKYVFLNKLNCYNCDNKKYNLKIIEEIIYNDKTNLVSKFKDYLILDDPTEFIRKYYNLNDILAKYPKITSYYNCSDEYLCVPNYSLLYERKYIYNNIKKKLKLNNKYLFDSNSSTLQQNSNLEKAKDINNNSNNTILKTDVYNFIMNDSSVNTVKSLKYKYDKKCFSSTFSSYINSIKSLNVFNSNYYRYNEYKKESISDCSLINNFENIIFNIEKAEKFSKNNNTKLIALDLKQNNKVSNKRSVSNIILTKKLDYKNKLNNKNIIESKNKYKIKSCDNINKNIKSVVKQKMQITNINLKRIVNKTIKDTIKNSNSSVNNIFNKNFQNKAIATNQKNLKNKLKPEINLNVEKVIEIENPILLQNQINNQALKKNIKKHSNQQNNICRNVPKLNIKKLNQLNNNKKVIYENDIDYTHFDNNINNNNNNKCLNKLLDLSKINLCKEEDKYNSYLNSARYTNNNINNNNSIHLNKKKNITKNLYILNNNSIIKNTTSYSKSKLINKDKCLNTKNFIFNRNKNKELLYNPYSSSINISNNIKKDCKTSRVELKKKQLITIDNTYRNNYNAKDINSTIRTNCLKDKNTNKNNNNIFNNKTRNLISNLNKNKYNLNSINSHNTNIVKNNFSSLLTIDNKNNTKLNNKEKENVLKFNINNISNRSKFNQFNSISGNILSNAKSNNKIISNSCIKLNKIGFKNENSKVKKILPRKIQIKTIEKTNNKLNDAKNCFNSISSASSNKNYTRFIKYK